MRFLQPSTHNLPSLKFLRKGRLIATAIYVSIFYLLFAVFAISVLTAHFQYAGSYYGVETFGIIYILFALSGVGILIHIRRLTLALVSKRRALQAGITMPQYTIDVTPVEASILIDAVDEGEVGHLILHSIQTKGGLRAWRSSDSRLHLQNLDTGVNLTYYEQTFMTWMFAHSATVTLTDRQLRRHRAMKAVHREIYQHMISQGYYAHMSAWQRFFYEYGITATNTVAYICYLPLVLGMTDQLFSVLAADAPAIIPVASTEQVVLVLFLTSGLLLTPLILLLFSTYTKKGSETFRNVFGLYWFLKVTYAAHLKNKQFLSKQDYEKYAPYAKAFGMDLDGEL